jgi:hypothetical protein
MGPSEETMTNRAGDDDRRSFVRARFATGATLTDAKTGKEWQTELVDLCIKGAFVSRPEDWHGKSGDPCSLALNLNAGLVISMSGHIAHVRPGGVGFAWDSIDIDDMAHLRRLLELNLGDGSLFQRELSALGRKTGSE